MNDAKYLPYDIINANDTLWLLFIINESCLSDNPAVTAISSQETISWCFRLTFVYDCSKWKIKTQLTLIEWIPFWNNWIFSSSIFLLVPIIKINEEWKLKRWLGNIKRVCCGNVWLNTHTHTQNGHTHILFRVSRANHSNFEKLLTKNRQMSRKCVLCLDNQDYHFAFHRSND